MNETIKNIKERRSIREYNDKKIDKEILNEILECGKYTASARNGQPWFFSVVSNKEINDTVVEETKRILAQSDNIEVRKMANNEDYHNFYNAPTVIYISNDKSSQYKGVDCFSAAQTMAVAAHSLGVSSVIVASVMPTFRGEKAEEINKMIGLKDGYEVVISIALGYSDSKVEPKERKKDDIVFID